jgi:hypothetical protein
MTHFRSLGTVMTHHDKFRDRQCILLNGNNACEVESDPKPIWELHQTGSMGVFDTTLCNSR